MENVGFVCFFIPKIMYFILYPQIAESSGQKLVSEYFLKKVVCNKQERAEQSFVGWCETRLS